MSIYHLSEINTKRLEAPQVKADKKNIEVHNNYIIFIFLFILGLFFGVVLSSYGYPDFSSSKEIAPAAITYSPQTNHEDMIVSTVDKASDSVVSVVISKEVPKYKKIEEQYDSIYDFFNFGIPKYEKDGTEVKEVGQGTGFFVSSDGMLLTNKHVALDINAEYTVITNQGKKYKAKILSQDPVQDLAILKIDSNDVFKPLQLGESSSVRVGQTAIAIGNALGEFQNTVSVGVISGLERTITASGAGRSELLENVIQTDAAINQGNSGGPLLNLKGEVIGINTAVSAVGQGLGFAIRVDSAKRAIEQTKKYGKISYPFLGVRYVLIDEEIAQEKELIVNNGALVVRGNNKNDVAVSPNSPADKAGIKEGDIILKINGEEISKKNSLAQIVRNYEPGEVVSVNILRDKDYITLMITLGEWSNN